MITPSELNTVWQCLGWWGMAAALAGRWDSDSRGGGGGPNRPWYDYDARGLHWTPIEDKTPSYSSKRTRQLTWTQIHAHGRASLTTSTMRQLGELLDTRRSEHTRHHQAMTAINTHWYSGADAPTRAALATEQRGHWATLNRLDAQVETILGPLLIDQPTDLIEYFESVGAS